jgi:hypothetical protein
VQPFHHEAPALTADMTKADLIDVLEHLPMQRNSCLVELDRDARDFIVRALKQQ